MYKMPWYITTRSVCIPASILFYSLQGLQNKTVDNGCLRNVCNAVSSRWLTFTVEVCVIVEGDREQGVLIIQHSFYICVSFCKGQNHWGFYCNAAAAHQSWGLFLLIAKPDKFLSTEACLAWLELLYVIYIDSTCSGWKADCFWKHLKVM